MATDPFAVFGRFDTTGSGGGVDHDRFGAVNPLLFPHTYPYPSPADGDDTYEDDEELSLRLSRISPLPPVSQYTYSEDGTVATANEGGVVTSFAYNADGTVSSMTRGGVTRTFVYSNDGMLIEVV